MPRLGYAGIALWPGTFSRTRSFITTTTTTEREGSSSFIGGKVETQVWLNRNFFFELGGAFGAVKFSQSALASGSPTTTDVTGDLLQLKAAAGYSYLVTGEFFGPKGWAKLGYRSTSYNLPVYSDPNEVLGPASFKSLFVGVGADLPVRANLGVVLNLELGLFSSAKETQGWISGVANATSVSAASATDLAFYIGGYYRLSHRIVVRLGLDVTSNSADFSNQGSLSHRIFTVSPALLYYF
jgi:hypothetical protein